MKKLQKSIQVDKKMYVDGLVVRESANIESRTIDISFASEVPYLRWFGYEIIDLASMDLDRLNDKAILLFNHEWDDYIGVVEKSWIGQDKKAYATVRFDVHEKADQIFTSLKLGIISKVSFGYEIEQATETFAIDGVDSFRVKVNPFEISFVTIPADRSVGYGKLKDVEEKRIEIFITVDDDHVAPCVEVVECAEVTMTEVIETLVEFKDEIKEGEEVKKEILTTNEEKVDKQINFLQNEIIIKHTEKKMDRNQINSEIAKLGKQYNAKDLALDFIERTADVTVDEFKNALLEQRSSSPEVQSSVSKDAEQDGYSMGLALKQLMNGEHSGVVKEMTQVLEKKHGQRRSESSILVPFNMAKRDVTVANAASAGNLKPKTLSNTYIESLYNELVIVKAGATYMSDLVGDIDIPKFNNIISAQYVGENAGATGSSLATSLIPLSGKDLTANIEVSRRMRMQSAYNIEALCSDQLIQAIRHKMDLDAMVGSGASNTVRGILNQSGIGSVTTGGTPTYQDILNLEAAVKSKNALLNKGAYVTTSEIEALLKGTQKGSGVGFIMENGVANNYNVFTTNGLPRTGTTPNIKSPLIFGDFSQLLIGTWGTIELQFNPYANPKTGLHELVIFVTFDVAVKHPESFAVASDITVG